MHPSFDFISFASSPKFTQVWRPGKKGFKGKREREREVKAEALIFPSIELKKEREGKSRVEWFDWTSITLFFYFKSNWFYSASLCLSIPLLNSLPSIPLLDVSPLFTLPEIFLLLPLYFSSQFTCRVFAISFYSTDAIIHLIIIHKSNSLNFWHQSCWQRERV